MSLYFKKHKAAQHMLNSDAGFWHKAMEGTIRKFKSSSDSLCLHPSARRAGDLHLPPQCPALSSLLTRILECIAVLPVVCSVFGIDTP